MTLDATTTSTLRASLAATGVLSILRGVPANRLVDTATALAAGGVRAIEVTADTPGALNAVSKWRELLPQLTVGIGTVLDEATAADAVAAGAQFLVAPNTDERVIHKALDLGVEMVPGALTPTEIVRAWDLGATMVKVFPVSSLGGPRYITSLRAPLPKIPLLAVGGVRPEEVVSYLAAGAVGTGIGASLQDRTLIESGRFDEVERRARDVITEISTVLAQP